MEPNINRRKGILLLEEEVDLCMLMRNFFRRKNYEVFIAYNAENAIQAINQITPDIIFTSTDVPGWERVRKHASVAAPNAEFLVGGLDKIEIKDL